MCPKEIYNVLMQEFADFHKISVDVRYWLIPSVSTGANAGQRGRNRSSSQSVSNMALKPKWNGCRIVAPVIAGSSPVKVAIRSLRLKRSRSSPFQGGNAGSIPAGITIMRL